MQALAEHPAVTVTGRVPDVRPYMAGAGIYVVPLRIGGGTRLKVLEAMAMGQALVSTHLGCDGFDFEQGRQVCFADDPATFAETAVALLRDRARGRPGPSRACLRRGAFRLGCYCAAAGGVVRVTTDARSGRQYIRLALLRAVGATYRKSSRPVMPRSILLIRPDHLGDMLFLTPALHALRQALPAARITLLGGPWGVEVVRHNPDLDAIETCVFPGFERQPKESSLAPYRLLAAAARKLRRAGCDTAVILRFDHWWGAWLAAAAGIPQRIGHDWPETRSFLTQALPYRSDRHEVQQNATLLAAFAPGIAADLGPTRYHVTDPDRAWIAEWLATQGHDSGQRLVAIHPGAGAAVKQWPAEMWAAVADRLAERPDVRIVLTGGPGELEWVGSIATILAHPALNGAGATTLGQLAALYARCALVLGSDSGPLHLAAAVDAPSVHLYGPVSPVKFGPWGDPSRHVVLRTTWPCAPCDRLDWSAAVLPQHACMAAITPDAVLRAADSLLRAA